MIYHDYLRQILFYKARLWLFRQLRKTQDVFNICEDKIQENMQELTKVHDFVVAPSFMEIVNYVFYCFNPGDGIDDEDDLCDCYDAILKDLLTFTYHEVALNYGEFVLALPYSKLSVELIS